MGVRMTAERIVPEGIYPPNYWHTLFEGVVSRLDVASAFGKSVVFDASGAAALSGMLKTVVGILDGATLEEAKALALRAERTAKRKDSEL